MRSFLKIIALVFVLFFHPEVRAQINVYSGQPLFSLPVLVLNANPTASKTAPKTAPSTGASLSYLPTSALKKATVAGYVERLQKKNPAASQAIAANFGTGKYDYGTIYNGLVKGNGLRENDAIDVMAAYLVMGYMVVHDVQDGNAVTPAMVQGVRTQIASQLLQNPQLTAPGVAAQLGEELKLQFVVVQGGWQSAIREHTLPAYQQGIAAMFKTQSGLDLASLQLTGQGFTTSRQPVTTSSSPSAKQSPASAVPGVEGWFFRAISGYPAAVTFEPVVLFKNGDYYEVGEQPLEMLDVAKAKQSNPAAWGTWQKKGEAYSLTDSKHRSTDYKLGAGNWFPAYPYSSSLPLKRAYERVSGGDYGAGTSALSVTKIQFLDAIHFSQGLNAGISSGNAAGWKKSKASGTYKLQGNTLELTYDDGKVVKTSFALGAQGAPPKPTVTLIFIGGYAYTDTD